MDYELIGEMNGSEFTGSKAFKQVIEKLGIKDEKELYERFIHNPYYLAVKVGEEEREVKKAGKSDY